jgi:nitroreductase
MTTLSAADLVEQLKWRYATKQFDPLRKIPAETWAALEEALILTPSSFGLQPWKFLVVTDAELKRALVGASWRQTQPADCSHHVVFAARRNLTEADVDHFISRTAEVRGSGVESLAGYRKVIVGFAANAAKEGWLGEWAIRQVYIALGNFMTSCAAIGVDTCPMEGIVPEQYDEILGLTGGEFTTVVACAAGYRAANDKYGVLAKVRFPVEEIIQRL